MYLKDEKLDFKNPYDRGYLKNLMEYFNILPPVLLGIDQNEGELFATRVV